MWNANQSANVHALEKQIASSLTRALQWLKEERQNGKSPPMKIPKDQLDLPVTFDTSAKMVTLREIMAKGHPSVLSPASLSLEKRAEITVKPH